MDCEVLHGSVGFVFKNFPFAVGVGGDVQGDFVTFGVEQFKQFLVRDRVRGKEPVSLNHLRRLVDHFGNDAGISQVIFVVPIFDA